LPHLESGFIHADQHIDTDIEQVAAVVESIAFLLTANVKLMRQHLPQLSTLVVGGGLSNCNYLCECLADLSTLAVLRLGERELTARGLAFLVAGRPATWLADQHTTRFMPSDYPVLRQREQRWQQAMAELVTPAPGK
jgi:glycerol kinase